MTTNEERLFKFYEEKINQGEFPDPDKDRDILFLREEKFGDTIAHKMAEKGFIFDLDRHRDILEVSNDDGVCVIHLMVGRGYVFDHNKYRDLLAILGPDGVSVAHILAYKCVFDPDKDEDRVILKGGEHGEYKDAYDRTPAYFMAWVGYLFDPDRHADILSLKDFFGKTVFDYLKEFYKFEFNTLEEYKAFYEKTPFLRNTSQAKSHKNKIKP